jgi:hypothetical protein
VTVLASVKPRVTDKVYKISSETLIVSIGPFSVLPDDYNGNSLVDSDLSAYVLAEGCTEPQPFDVSHYCLIPVPNLNWLVFYPGTSSLSVYTDDQSLNGTYTVYIV